MPRFLTNLATVQRFLPEYEKQRRWCLRRDRVALQLAAQQANSSVGEANLTLLLIESLT